MPKDNNNNTLQEDIAHNNHENEDWEMMDAPTDPNAFFQAYIVNLQDTPPSYYRERTMS